MSELEQSGMRAGDADREQVVARLNTAFAEGRLDVRELHERVAAAYGAKTLGALVPLTADLPETHRPGPPAPHSASAAGMTPRPAGEPGAVEWWPVGGALGLFLVNVLVWGLVSLGASELVYFWPMWTAIPLVFAVVGVVGSRKRR